MAQSHHNSLDHASPQVSDHGRADGKRELVLVKNGQRYVFVCAAGEENELVAQLRALARDPDADFNWTDAAMVCHQVGVHLRQRIQDQE
ncbi:MAG: hypothetical protein ACODAQ_01145 [Phycisphaeraceae bacterium]